MKPEFKKCCIFLALLAAAAVLIVLFIKWNEADVSITIGFPVEAGEGMPAIFKQHLSSPCYHAVQNTVLLVGQVVDNPIFRRVTACPHCVNHAGLIQPYGERVSNIFFFGPYQHNRVRRHIRYGGVIQGFSSQQGKQDAVYSRTA